MARNHTVRLSDEERATLLKHGPTVSAGIHRLIADAESKPTVLVMMRQAITDESERLRRARNH